MKKIIILIFLAIISLYISREAEYVEIPSSSIRMRVIAASNSKEDQNNKKIVKDALEKKLYDITSNLDNVDDIDFVLENEKQNIDNYISDTIKNNNINNSFVSNYGYNYFPEKEFKGLLYASGNYRSFVVTLGEGSGENWWCVLYPPICLVNEEIDNYEYQFLINNLLKKYN